MGYQNHKAYKLVLWSYNRDNGEYIHDYKPSFEFDDDFWLIDMIIFCNSFIN